MARPVCEIGTSATDVARLGAAMTEERSVVLTPSEAEPFCETRPGVAVLDPANTEVEEYGDDDERVDAVGHVTPSLSGRCVLGRPSRSPVGR